MPLEKEIENTFETAPSATSNLNFYIEIENRVLKLAADHQDIIGTSVMVGEIKNGRQMPDLYKATVILYTHSNPIIVEVKHEHLYMALKEAIETAEMQIQKRQKQTKEKLVSRKMTLHRILHTVQNSPGKSDHILRRE